MIKWETFLILPVFDIQTNLTASSQQLSKEP
jgi:hypothetical protein